MVVNSSCTPVLWRVNERGFIHSSIVNSTTIWFLQASDGLVVSDDLLALGQNYFLSKINSLSQSTEQTYTLNLTSQCCYGCKYRIVTMVIDENFSLRQCDISVWKTWSMSWSQKALCATHLCSRNLKQFSQVIHCWDWSGTVLFEMEGCYSQSCNQIHFLYTLVSLVKAFLWLCPKSTTIIPPWRNQKWIA